MLSSRDILYKQICIYVSSFIFYSNTAYVIHNPILCFFKNGDTIYIEQNARVCVCEFMYSYTHTCVYHPDEDEEHSSTQKVTFSSP